MVESKAEHDVLNRSVSLFVGDDTGLLKQVKLQAKCTVVSHTIDYGETAKKRMRTVVDEDGVKRDVEARPGKLNAHDNQRRTEYETTVKFKLAGKYGEQARNQGLQVMSWTDPSHISYLKGKSNIACIFNTETESAAHSKDYTDLFSPLDATVVGLHPLSGGESVKATKHLLVSDKGHILVDAIGARKLPKKKSLGRVKGESVWKSFKSDFEAAVAICQ